MEDEMGESVKQVASLQGENAELSMKLHLAEEAVRKANITQAALEEADRLDREMRQRYQDCLVDFTHKK
eukprot:6613750-Pyramimonas_sp.AAC.1